MKIKNKITTTHTKPTIQTKRKKDCMIKLNLVSKREREEFRVPSYGYLIP